MFSLISIKIKQHVSFSTLNLVRQLSFSLTDGDVIFSKSRDIFYNLALEDCLYRYVDFTDKNVLLMWINEPAIVIGRHQNPWVECHLSACHGQSVSVARRNSGGGTVYHDSGNLNCSFITSKKNYNRKKNLTLISDVLRRYWSIESEINKREDLVLSGSGEKISGTASKLGAKSAYHHCTLLIDVDLNNMRKFIRKSAPAIESNATSSVPAVTRNLKVVNPNIELNQVVEQLNDEFSKIHKGRSNSLIEILPAEDIMSSQISETYSQLRSWDWIYGKTPRFFVRETFDLSMPMSCDETGTKKEEFEMIVEVFHGVIENIKISPNIENLFNNLNCLHKVKFCEESLEEHIDKLQYSEEHLLVDCVLKCVEKSL